MTVQLILQQIVEVLSDLIKDYNPSDIFNAVEAGLYWKMIPREYHLKTWI